MPYVSVVVCTYNRAHTIADTMQSLRAQTFRDFEIIVVIGPCTDNTDEVLSEFKELISIYRTEERNLSKSRNIGIQNAVGAIVAFIDDDAVADPRWLEELVEPYVDPVVGGVGGLVYDHSGVKLQYRYSVCYRRGETKFDVLPPFDDYVRPGCDPFLYIQGTNASFRVSALLEIGGFNEDIEYYHDETDVCMRIIDKGYHIKSLDGANVIHRYAPSHIRNLDKVVFDPYTTVKNQYLFCLQNGRYSQTVESLYCYLLYYKKLVLDGARWNFRHGKLTSAQFENFTRRVDEGVMAGVMAGDAPRNNGMFTPKAATPQFPEKKRNSLPENPGSPLNIIYVSQEYPPDQIGGIGRFTCDLAEQMAKNGHVVHVITRSITGQPEMDYRNGVYIHKIVYSTPDNDVLKISSSAWNLAHQFSVYNYITDLEKRFQIDVVSAPIWLCEGLIIALSGRWPNILTLHTTMKTIIDLHPAEAEKLEAREIIKLEKLAFASAQVVQANSDAVLQKCIDDFGHREGLFTVPHGISAPRKINYKALSKDFTSKFSGESKIVLFVGRVELRKGADILLDAVSLIFPSGTKRKWPSLRVMVAGPPSANTGKGTTFEDWFGRERGDILERGCVQFLGELSADELAYAYEKADMLVLPSRFESFGLVLLEALRCGVPVIASASGGMAEVVQPAYGRLFEPGNPQDLKRKIMDLYSDVDLRAAMSEAALEVAKTTFSMANISSQITEQYRSAVAHHHMRRADFREHDPIRIAVHLSDALGVDLSSARLICSRLAPEVATKSRVERLLKAAVALSDVDFLDMSYMTILGRKFEQACTPESATSAFGEYGGRLGFCEKLIASDEAQRIPGMVEFSATWQKLVRGTGNV